VGFHPTPHSLFEKSEEKLFQKFAGGGAAFHGFASLEINTAVILLE